MSYISTPVAVTGAAIDFVNPGNTGYQQQVVQVQIRNASGWVVTTPGPTGPQMIDPFTATTIPTIQGLDAVLAPIYNAYPKLAGYASAEWLAVGESPSQPDGPLTSAATIAALAGSTARVAAAGAGTILSQLLDGTQYTIYAALLTGYYLPGGSAVATPELTIPDPVSTVDTPILITDIEPVSTTGKARTVELSFPTPILTAGAVKASIGSIIIGSTQTVFGVVLYSH